MQTLTASMEFDAFRLKTIVVDLTPVLPGGYNGGAKVFVLELIRRLALLRLQLISFFSLILFPMKS